MIDPQDERRYEVEIQLGATDESHIIRTIEYWDNERRRYPQFEHCAVIVAEEITSRFFNVISLFNRSIPLIAIQMNLLEVGEVMTLSFTTVLDERTTPSDRDPDLDPDPKIKEITPDQKAICDLLLGEIITPVVEGCELHPTKNYLGIRRNGRVENFINIIPKKKVFHFWFRYPRDPQMDRMIEDFGFHTLSYNKGFGYYRLALSSGDEIIERKEGLQELTKRAFKYHSTGQLT